MRSLLGSLLGLLGAALTLAGCPTCPQPDGTCPLVSFGDHEAGAADGQIQWSFGGRSGSLGWSTMPGAPRMSCSAYLTMGIGATSGGLPPRGATIAIACSTTDNPDTDFGLWICLGDAFSWSPGALAIPPAQSPSGAPCGSEPRAELWYVADCGSIASCGACRAPAIVSVVVEDASGGAAPPPALVTADYRRTFRVELLMPNPVVGQNEKLPGVCATGVSITGSVHFASTPSDFIYEPDHVCEPHPCLG